MTTNSHSRGFEEDHSRGKVKKENSKVNGKRMSQEEIDKEIAEMKEKINVWRMILEESQRLGWVLKKNPVKWHKLQRRLQQRQVKRLVEEISEAELEMEVSICEREQGEVLGEDEDLKTETSSETKGSHDFKSDHFCMFTSEKCDEGQFVDIDIKHEEVEKDIRQSSEGLDEIEERTIEIFLSHVKDLEQQEDLVIE